MTIDLLLTGRNRRSIENTAATFSLQNGREGKHRGEAVHVFCGLLLEGRRSKSRGKNLEAKISQQKSRKQKSRVAKISRDQNLEFVFYLVLIG